MRGTLGQCETTSQWNIGTRLVSSPEQRITNRGEGRTGVGPYILDYV